MESALGKHLVIERGAAPHRGGLFYRSETAYGLIEYLQSVGSLRGQRLLERSHGEGALEMLEATASAGGVWIFDEPESGLSFTGQLRLMSLMLAHLEAGHQIIMCTHSPLMMNLPGTVLIEIGEWGARLADIENLESLFHWKQFLDAPGRYLKHL